LLLGVSRTFALTIPQLPQELQQAVGNGYLLCRIADTIEDDAGIGLDDKFSFYEEFLQVLKRRADAVDFSRRLHAALSGSVHPAEHELIRLTPTVLHLTRSLPEARQEALLRCATIMCNGMYEFQARKSLDGLGSVPEMSRYCYVVAGVVGEMLTDLFCDYSAAMNEKREAMMNLAVCFGQGLQMTNILKDIWEDRREGSCWLPQSIFSGHGNDLGEILRREEADALAEGIRDLVGIAHNNLQSALAYNRLIPKSEVGVRKFCLWAIGMAIVTLQKIYRNPGYVNGQQVKISRQQVWAVVFSTNSIIYSNRLLRAWFEVASIGLPHSARHDVCDPEELSDLVHSASAAAWIRHSQDLHLSDE